MLATSDEVLVQQALKHHKQAWLKLIKRYEGLVYNYAYRMLGNADDARDLLQEVFIAVYKNLETWRGDSSFKSWLMVIARNRCIEHYRRRRDYGSEAELDATASEDEWHDPEKVYASQQQGRQLQHAMQGLPLEQKEVVEMKFFQHLKLTEIAEQLGISTNTAKSRLYSGVEKLKSTLEVSL